MGKFKKLYIVLLCAVLVCVLGTAAFAHLLYKGKIWFVNPAAMGYQVKGVEADQYHGEIKWELMYRSDVDFALVRATESVYHVDLNLKENVQGAGDNCIPLAFSHAFSPGTPGRMQAQFFLESTREYQAQLPPVLELGKDDGGESSRKEIIENVKEFLEEVEEQTGVTPVILTNGQDYRRYLKDGGLEQYPLWMSDMVKKPEPEDGEKVLFWQYCSRGRVAGASDKAFMNLSVFNGSAGEFEELLSRTAAAATERGRAEKPPEAYPEPEETPGGEEKNRPPRLKLSCSGPEDFVPEGYELLDRAELDFNRDGVTDFVGVLEEASPEAGYEENGGLHPRILFALRSLAEGSYALDFWDRNLIRARSEGGVSGDPYLPLSAGEASFTTHAYGGSAWRWSEDYTYTYKDGEWYLTGRDTSYGYGDFITSSETDDYEKGVGIRRRRGDDVESMTQEDGRGFDLIYEVRLDEAPTLAQAGKRWQFAPDRVSGRPVETILLAEGAELSEEDIVLPEDAGGISFQNESCALYTFTDGKASQYLALYREADRTLTVLARGPAEKECFGSPSVYAGKVFFYDASEEARASVRLCRMNPDGTDRREIFCYDYGGAAAPDQNAQAGSSLDQEDASAQAPLPEAPVPYLYLSYEVTGGEVYAEIGISGEPHPVFRMDTDGGGLREIGSVG